MPALFISDLHLSPGRPETADLLLGFLSGRARGAEALYILGDLFEYWAGDDDLGDRFNARIAAGLAAAAASGTRLFFMRGNRDFLAGEGLARAASLSLLEDPYPLSLFGTPTLLSHGDELCTDDAAYQAFRRQVRDPAWAISFLARPLDERKREIERLRSLSEEEKRRKAADIMDANPAAVEALLQRYGCRRLIHGHTHRQARHIHKVEGRTCERWVLPDWHATADVLVVDEHGARFEPI
jgi:UDP-2,3-diacylglucosamine hydrolase